MRKIDPFKKEFENDKINAEIAKRVYKAKVKIFGDALGPSFYIYDTNDTVNGAIVVTLKGTFTKKGIKYIEKMKE